MRGSEIFFILALCWYCMEVELYFDIKEKSYIKVASAKKNKYARSCQQGNTFY